MRQKLTGLFFACMAAIAFGAVIVLNKLALKSGIKPIVLVGYTSVEVAVLCIPILYWKRQDLFKLNKKLLFQVFIIALTATILPSILHIWGQQLTSAINAGFLTSLSAFFTIIFAGILLKERIARLKVKYVLLLFLGVYLLSSFFKGFHVSLGDSLIIIATILLGFSNAYARFPMRTIDSSLVAALRLIIGGLVFLIYLFFMEKESLYVFSTINLVYISIGLLLWIFVMSLYKAIKIMGANTAVLVTVSYPIVSFAGSIIFLHESSTVFQFIGGSLIIFSIYNLWK